MKKILGIILITVLAGGAALGGIWGYRYMNREPEIEYETYTVGTADMTRKMTLDGEIQYSSTAAVPGIGSRIDVNTTDLAPAAFPKKTTEKPASKSKEEPKPVTKISFPTLPKRGYFNKNDKGDEVKKLQTLLNKRGFNCGKVDGIYGTVTINAVKNFQKKNKLTADGLFGKQSLTILKQLFK